MAHRTVLILTHGRSGSTLLQGVLNALDGFRIHGENHNFMFRLLDAHQALCKAKAEYNEKSDFATSPWFSVSSIGPDAFLAEVGRVTLSSLFSEIELRQHEVVGFKEIRYFSEFSKSGGAERLSDFLEFARKTLPDCKFVFLTRDPAQTVVSAWWRGNSDKKKLKSDLSRFHEFMRGFAEKTPELAYCLDYADMTGKTARFWSLFDFLDARPDREVISEVLSTAHSYALNKEIVDGRIVGDKLPKSQHRAGAGKMAGAAQKKQSFVGRIKRRARQIIRK